jgi:hypothetical protein
LCKESVLIALPYCGMGFLLWKLSGYLSQGEPVPTLVPSPFCSSVSTTGEFSPNFDLKSMISSYKRIFHGKKMAQLCQISNLKNFKSLASYDNFQKVAKSVEGLCFISTFISTMESNLAKVFSGWSQHWVHGKIHLRNAAP